MENIRTKKSVTTLLFDCLMLTIAWASFFFEETVGMWGKVIYAACFIFALIDVTLWTTGNKQVKVITSKEVGLCVVQALLVVALAVYGIVEAVAVISNPAAIVFVAMAVGVIIFAGFIGVKALKKQPSFYHEFRFGASFDVVLALFLIYNFVNKGIDEELTLFILSIALLAVDLSRSLIRQK